MLLEVVPVLAIFGRLTLDFRESKCFLREPETLVEMKKQLTKISGNLVNKWTIIVSFNSALSRTIIQGVLVNL